MPAMLFPVNPVIANIFAGKTHASDQKEIINE